MVHTKYIPWVLGMLLTTACSQPGVKSSAANAEPIATQPEPAIAAVVPDNYPKQALTPEILYQFLLAEIAGQRGEVGLELADGVAADVINDSSDYVAAALRHAQNDNLVVARSVAIALAMTLSANESFVNFDGTQAKNVFSIVAPTNGRHGFTRRADANCIDFDAQRFGEVHGVFGLKISRIIDAIGH